MGDRLCSAVIAGDAAAIDVLLHPQALYMALGKTLDQLAEVRAELLADATRSAWQSLVWQPALALGEPGGALRLTGDRAAGSRDRGLVVTLLLDADRIRCLQVQRVPPPPPPARALVLPAALRAAINSALVERHPMLMSHMGRGGQPVLSYRGSVQVMGDDQLGLWVRNPAGGLIAAIGANPRVTLMYRNEDSRATYQFQGRARVSGVAADRQQIFDRAAYAERAHDFAMLGAAVLIDLDRVEGWAGVGPQGQIDTIHLQRGA